MLMPDLTTFQRCIRSGNNAQLIAFLSAEEQLDPLWQPVMFKVTVKEGLIWLASLDLPRTTRGYGGR